MLFQPSKLALVPILSLAIAPAVKAAPMIPAAAPESAVVIAQMTQLYCRTYAPAGSIGLTVYNSPNGNVIGRLRDGVTVAYNIGDRSGNWAEVSDANGTTGWVETIFLGCEGYASDFSETSEESYEESYEETYTEEYYEEVIEETYVEETYEESYEETYTEETYEESYEEYSY